MTCQKVLGLTSEDTLLLLQRSDSVNCPVDRAVLRRQDRIEEEFDPEEINESLTSPGGGGSRRGSGRSPLTGSIVFCSLNSYVRHDASSIAAIDNRCVILLLLLFLLLSLHQVLAAKREHMEALLELVNVL